MRRLRRTDFLGFTSTTYTTSKKLNSRRHKRARRVAAGDPPSPKTKKKRSGPRREFKYGLELPRTWKDILRIDEHNGNRRWQDAVEKEVGALLQLGCFEFMAPDYKPPSDYQYCRLHFVYEIKHDLRCKARLVVDGSRVDPRGLSTRSTVVKTVSIRLLDLIADAQNLQVLCGDIGNAFVTAHTEEKIYTRVGPEFGARAGSVAVIVKALYGLTTSAERFHKLFADIIRSLGFRPCRFDRDVWMRLRDSKTGYDYICTHVDDFKVVARDAQYWMDKIADVLYLKEQGPREYYLGCDYKYHDGQDI